MELGQKTANMLYSNCDLAYQRVTSKTKEVTTNYLQLPRVTNNNREKDDTDSNLLIPLITHGNSQ